MLPEPESEFVEAIRYLTGDLGPEELVHMLLVVAEIACEKDVNKFSMKMSELIIKEIELAIREMPPGPYAEAALGIGLSNAAVQDYTKSLLSETTSAPQVDLLVDGAHNASWGGNSGEC